MICDNISVSKEGHLLFAGQDTIELAKKYGTPVYLMDEDKIRQNCRTYKKAFEKTSAENLLRYMRPKPIVLSVFMKS